MNICITIFEKDKKVKVFPLSKKIQIYNDDLEVSFDFKSKSLVKKEISTKKLLSLSPSERLFYQKIFFKYLYETKSWEPQGFESAFKEFKLPSYKVISR